MESIQIPYGQHGDVLLKPIELLGLNDFPISEEIREVID
jgi:hypothetical protein